MTRQKDKTIQKGQIARAYYVDGKRPRDITKSYNINYNQFYRILDQYFEQYNQNKVRFEPSGIDIHSNYEQGMINRNSDKEIALYYNNYDYIHNFGKKDLSFKERLKDAYKNLALYGVAPDPRYVRT